MIVASTMVPLVILMPLRCRWSLTAVSSSLAELVALQQVAELADRRLVRRAFDPEIDADEAAHRHRVVQRFLHRRVRQVEPQLQEVNPQHPLQRNRRTPAVLADLRVHRLHRRRQLRPRNDLGPCPPGTARAASSCRTSQIPPVSAASSAYPRDHERMIKHHGYIRVSPKSFF